MFLQDTFQQKKRARRTILSRVPYLSTFRRARFALRFRFLASIALAIMAAGTARSYAAAGAGCDGGGFSLLGLSGDQRVVVPAGAVPSSFLVKGKYVEFTVDSATFGVRDWTLTGAPNPLDITGNRRTVVFASKMPDHSGIVLDGDVEVSSSGEALVISRTGPGLTMKIQAKDCANGGVFQMEIERADGAATTFTHVLGDGVFYFDNPNVRDRIGEKLPCSGVLPDGTPVACNGANPDGTVTVTARVNFANDFSSKFVGRDSSQLAARIAGGCPNNIPNPSHPGTVNHCGGISQWSVASGGRMGQVMGEDAGEIAPAASPCAENCTAQNQVNGLAVVVGFPFPVPAEVRLQPRFPQASNGQLAGLTMSASSVNGGSSAKGVVSLNAGAPAGGVLVSLSSANPNVVTLPANVTIPSGAVEASFNVATSAVSANTAVTLSASAGGTARSAILEVKPAAAPALDSVAITRAEYTVSKRQLRVEATGSNASATLSVYVSPTGAAIGTLTNDGAGRYRGQLNFATNPGNVTVKSTGGGTASRAVVAK